MAGRKRGTGRRQAGRAAGGGEAIVTSVLQSYADRGVFRGLHLSDGRGRVNAEFVWLLGRPMRAIWDPASARLAFPGLMPGVDPRSEMAGELRVLVRERSTAAVQEHKRVDRRRAKVEARVRGGALSLDVTVRGANHEYAIRRALNLINDMFLLLHASYPDYLIERFGLSSE